MHQVPRKTYTSIAVVVMWSALSVGCAELEDEPNVEPNPLPKIGPGLFHLTGEQGDSNPTNIHLASDGTFAWGVSGCDYFGGDLGTWTRDGDRVVLRPSAGKARFLWTGPVTSPVDEVVLDGSATGFRASLPSMSSNDQQWQEGGICPVCNGEFRAAACDDPYLADRPAL